MSSRCLLFASLVVTLSRSPLALGAPLPPRQGPHDGPLGMKFVRLPAGTFYMGWDGEKKGTKTAIKEDFEIAIHTVTQGQWQELMGNNPSHFARAGGGKAQVKDIADADLKQFPVEQVTWDNCQQFIKVLNERERANTWTYRLPNEAEWEYACRGGATSEKECSYHFYFDQPTNQITSHLANFNGFDQVPDPSLKGPSLGRPTKVGAYKPNRLGLHDMHANVCQWCADLVDGSFRVYRGGCWAEDVLHCRATSREKFSGSGSGVGFRLVRVASGGK